MARKKVITVPMFKYKRSAPKTPFLRWGYIATRKMTTEATSPVLLGYRGCIAGKLSGKEFANLKEVQEAFRDATQECKPKAK